MIIIISLYEIIYNNDDNNNNNNNNNNNTNNNNVHVAEDYCSGLCIDLNTIHLCLKEETHKNLN